MADGGRTYATVHQEYQSEKAKRRGTGFIGFLSDLDWLLSLEVEEGKPINDSKITTAQRFSAFGQGFGFGLGTHMAVLFGISFALYSLIFSMKIESEWGIHLIFFGIVFFSLLIKYAIPKWLIDDYYIFPSGITYTYLSWFMVGFSFGLFVPEIIYTLIVIILTLIVTLFNSSFMSYEWWAKISPYLTKYFPHITSLKWIPFHILMMFTAFIPYFLLKWHRKRNPIQKYKWIPLDEVPPED